jgi:hypothetical protein
MRNPIRAWWEWIRDDRVLFATPEVGRVFMVCTECRRVRPAYEIVMRAGTYARVGCACGSKTHKPSNLSQMRAAWWLLVKGYLWRKAIRRQADWDPRLPLRNVS